MANPSGSCSPAREWTSVASAVKMVNPGEVPINPWGLQLPSHLIAFMEGAFTRRMLAMQRFFEMRT